MSTFRYSTPDGFDDLLMCTDGEVLTGLHFVETFPETSSELFPETSQSSIMPPVIRDTCRWLDIYFSGLQPDFTPVFLMNDLTPFRKAVLDIVCEIPFGQIITYGDVAKRLGIKSAQAVGGAVGWNPICLIVPCHRVMGANGNLTGYGGGLQNKIALLKLERSLMV